VNVEGDPEGLVLAFEGPGFGACGFGFGGSFGLGPLKPLKPPPFARVNLPLEMKSILFVKEACRAAVELKAFYK
jgi:hypothetical protein